MFSFSRIIEILISLHFNKDHFERNKVFYYFFKFLLQKNSKIHFLIQIVNGGKKFFVVFFQLQMILIQCTLIQ